MQPRSGFDNNDLPSLDGDLLEKPIDNGSSEKRRGDEGMVEWPELSEKDRHNSHILSIREWQPDYNHVPNTNQTIDGSTVTVISKTKTDSVNTINQKERKREKKKFDNKQVARINNKSKRSSSECIRKQLYTSSQMSEEQEKKDEEKDYHGSSSDRDGVKEHSSSLICFTTYVDKKLDKNRKKKKISNLADHFQTAHFKRTHQHNSSAIQCRGNQPSQHPGTHEVFSQPIKCSDLQGSWCFSQANQKHRFCEGSDEYASGKENQERWILEEIANSKKISGNLYKKIKGYGCSKATSLLTNLDIQANKKSEKDCANMNVKKAIFEQKKSTPIIKLQNNRLNTQSQLKRRMHGWLAHSECKIPEKIQETVLQGMVMAKQWYKQASKSDKARAFAVLQTCASLMNGKAEIQFRSLEGENVGKVFGKEKREKIGANAENMGSTSADIPIKKGIQSNSNRDETISLTPVENQQSSAPTVSNDVSKSYFLPQPFTMRGDQAVSDTPYDSDGSGGTSSHGSGIHGNGSNLPSEKGDGKEPTQNRRSNNGKENDLNNNDDDDEYVTNSNNIDVATATVPTPDYKGRRKKLEGHGELNGMDINQALGWLIISDTGGGEPDPELEEEKQQNQEHAFQQLSCCLKICLHDVGENVSLSCLLCQHISGLLRHVGGCSKSKDTCNNCLMVFKILSYHIQKCLTVQGEGGNQCGLELCEKICTKLKDRPQQGEELIWRIMKKRLRCLVSSASVVEKYESYNSISSATGSSVFPPNSFSRSGNYAETSQSITGTLFPNHPIPLANSMINNQVFMGPADLARSRPSPNMGTGAIPKQRSKSSSSIGVKLNQGDPVQAPIVKQPLRRTASDKSRFRPSVAVIEEESSSPRSLGANLQWHHIQKTQNLVKRGVSSEDPPTDGAVDDPDKGPTENTPGKAYRGKECAASHVPVSSTLDMIKQQAKNLEPVPSLYLTVNPPNRNRHGSGEARDQIDQSRKTSDSVHGMAPSVRYNSGMSIHSKLTDTRSQARLSYMSGESGLSGQPFLISGSAMSQDPSNHSKMENYMRELASMQDGFQSFRSFHQSGMPFQMQGPLPSIASLYPRMNSMAPHPPGASLFSPTRLPSPNFQEHFADSLPDRFMSTAFKEANYKSLQMEQSRLPGTRAVEYGTQRNLKDLARHWTTLKKALQHGIKIFNKITNNSKKEEGIILRKDLKIVNERYQKNIQWEKISFLGSGVAGRCHLALDYENEFKFCVKKVCLLSYHEDELALWTTLQHRFIVQLYGAIRVGKKLYIFMELMEGGSLSELIKKQGQLNQLQALEYLHQTLQALVYMADKRIIHEDLKGDNILIAADSLRIAITDFGLSKRLPQGQPIVGPGHSPVGAQTQWSPEKAASEGYDHGADVWAAMCVLVHMLSGEHVWVRRYPQAALLHFIIKMNSPPLQDIPEKVHPDIADLLQKGFNTNAKQRPSARQLLKHQAFQMLNLGAHHTNLTVCPAIQATSEGGKENSQSASEGGKENDEATSEGGKENDQAESEGGKENNQNQASQNADAENQGATVVSENERERINPQEELFEEPKSTKDHVLDDAHAHVQKPTSRDSTQSVEITSVPSVSSPSEVSVTPIVTHLAPSLSQTEDQKQNAIELQTTKATAGPEALTQQSVGSYNSNISGISWSSSIQASQPNVTGIHVPYKYGSPGIPGRATYALPIPKKDHNNTTAESAARMPMAEVPASTGMNPHPGGPIAYTVSVAHAPQIEGHLVTTAASPQPIQGALLPQIPVGPAFDERRTSGPLPPFSQYREMPPFVPERQPISNDLIQSQGQARKASHTSKSQHNTIQGLEPQGPPVDAFYQNRSDVQQNFYLGQQHGQIQAGLPGVSHAVNEIPKQDTARFQYNNQVSNMMPPSMPFLVGEMQQRHRVNNIPHSLTHVRDTGCPLNIPLTTNQNLANPLSQRLHPSAQAKIKPNVTVEENAQPEVHPKMQGQNLNVFGSNEAGPCSEEEEIVEKQDIEEQEYPVQKEGANPMSFVPTFIESMSFHSKDFLEVGTEGSQSTECSVQSVIENENKTKPASQPSSPDVNLGLSEHASKPVFQEASVDKQGDTDQSLQTLLLSQLSSRSREPEEHDESEPPRTNVHQTSAFFDQLTQEELDKIDSHELYGSGPEQKLNPDFQNIDFGQGDASVRMNRECRTQESTDLLSSRGDGDWNEFFPGGYNFPPNGQHVSASVVNRRDGSGSDMPEIRYHSSSNSSVEAQVSSGSSEGRYLSSSPSPNLMEKGNIPPDRQNKSKLSVSNLPNLSIFDKSVSSSTVVSQLTLTEKEYSSLAPDRNPCIVASANQPATLPAIPDFVSAVTTKDSFRSGCEPSDESYELPSGVTKNISNFDQHSGSLHRKSPRHLHLDIQKSDGESQHQQIHYRRAESSPGHSKEKPRSLLRRESSPGRLSRVSQEDDQRSNMTTIVSTQITEKYSPQTPGVRGSLSSGVFTATPSPARTPLESRKPPSKTPSSDQSSGIFEMPSASPIAPNRNGYKFASPQGTSSIQIPSKQSTPSSGTLCFSPHPDRSGPPTPNTPSPDVRQRTTHRSGSSPGLLALGTSPGSSTGVYGTPNSFQRKSSFSRKNNPGYSRQSSKMSQDERLDLEVENFQKELLFDHVSQASADDVGQLNLTEDPESSNYHLGRSEHGEKDQSQFKIDVDEEQYIGQVQEPDLRITEAEMPSLLNLVESFKKKPIKVKKVSFQLEDGREIVSVGLSSGRDQKWQDLVLTASQKIHQCGFHSFTVQYPNGEVLDLHGNTNECDVSNVIVAIATKESEWWIQDGSVHYSHSYGGQFEANLDELPLFSEKK